MARPKIRHLAIFARNPRALAEFYRDVLEMEIINSEPDGSAFFVSDGYLTLALLPHRLEGSAPVGINHFGFAVDPTRNIAALIRKETGSTSRRMATRRPKRRRLATSAKCRREAVQAAISGGCAAHQESAQF
jgi:catechol 2,3-dioxygenase-like lactoylglutathione lyase family enzyme